MYFIILYDETRGEVTQILSFGKEDADRAFETYNRLETAYLHDASISVNLVTAHDPKDLKTTWRRFFREIYVDWDWSSNMSGQT